jgi:hypothetical protein
VVLDKQQTQPLEMALILFLILLHQLMAGKVLVIFQQRAAVSVKMAAQAVAAETQQAQEQRAKVTMAAQVLALHLHPVAVEKAAQAALTMEVLAVQVEHHQIVL